MTSVLVGGLGLGGLSWGVGSSSSCASSCLGGLAHLHLALHLSGLGGLSWGVVLGGCLGGVLTFELKTSVRGLDHVFG